MPRKVIVSEEEYRKLLADALFLETLQACGVDNWEGYSEAVTIMEDENNGA